MSHRSTFGTVPAARMGRLAAWRRLLLGEARGTPPSTIRSTLNVERPRPDTHRAGDAMFMEMHLKLTASLDAVAGTRKSLRNLAHFEKTFAVKGLEAIDLLSAARLRRAHAELVILMNVAPTSVGLASLEARMSTRLAARAPRTAADVASSKPAGPPADMQVSEGTLADFDQAVADSDLADL